MYHRVTILIWLQSYIDREKEKHSDSSFVYPFFMKYQSIALSMVMLQVSYNHNSMQKVLPILMMMMMARQWQ